MEPSASRAGGRSGRSSGARLQPRGVQLEGEHVLVRANGGVLLALDALPRLALAGARPLQLSLDALDREILGRAGPPFGVLGRDRSNRRSLAHATMKNRERRGGGPLRVHRATGEYLSASPRASAALN